MGGISYAFSHLMEAVAERDKARGECDHSWGYYGARFEDRVEKAEKDFIDAIMQAIQERTTEAKDAH